MRDANEIMLKFFMAIALVFLVWGLYRVELEKRGDAVYSFVAANKDLTNMEFTEEQARYVDIVVSVIEVQLSIDQFTVFEDKGD